MIARTSVDLLRSMRETLGVGAYLLIGIDRVKNLDILIPAYDDRPASPPNLHSTC